MHDVNTQIPVMFERLEEHKVEDTRFVKVKIWLLHLGKNHNGSSFSKEATSRAIPSLANTPILGYVEANAEREDDFSDHRNVMERKSDGTWTYKNIGVPYGLIPENNNAQFEFRLCDDGQTREFLTVEGLLWTKWQDSVDILSRDGVKNQSMELHSEYEGYMGDDSYFHFTNFQFYGACILGMDYQPAMENSTVEMNFNVSDTDSLNSYVQEKMEQFKLFSLNIKEQEGRDGMKKKLELLTKFSKTEEDIKALDIDLKEISFEELEAKLKESDETEEATEEAVEAKTEEAEEVKEDFEDEEEAEKVEDESAEATEEDKEEVAIVNEEEAEEATIPYEELMENFNALQSKFDALETESVELREFKSSRLNADRKTAEVGLFEEYDMLVGIKEYEAIKANSSKFEDIEDLEKEIALVFARNRAKINFSSNEEDEDRINFNIDKNIKDKVTKYGDLFEKYGE